MNTHATEWAETGHLQPILKLDNVTKTYNSAPDGHPVLQGIDLTVEQGESLAIVGPSGSGKSTLLNIIGTLDRPTSGDVVLNGKSVLDLNETQLARIRNRTIGFVFQLHHLLPQCSALENVLVPTLVNPEAGADVELRALELLDRVGLSDRASYRPGELSGGERQRVAVIRALINQPTLLLADEPTGSLDHATAAQLVELLAELNREQHVTLILVTHATNLSSRMGRVLILKDGVLAKSV